MRGHRPTESITSATAMGELNIRRIAGFLTPYWPRLALIIITVVITALLGLFPPLLVRSIIDDAMSEGNRSLLIWLCAWLVISVVISGLIGMVRSFLNIVVSQRIMYDLRLKMFSRLQALSLRFFTEARTGELMSRLTSDIAGIDTVISGTLISITTNVLILSTTLVAMAAIDWRLTVVSVMVLPWLIIPTLTVGKVRRGLRSERQKQSGALNSFMAESLGISGLMLIKTFTQERQILNLFKKHARGLMDLQVRESLVGRWYFMLLTTVTTGGPALIYWYGGGQVISAELTVGTIVAFVALLTRLYGPATEIMTLHVDIVTSAAYFERIFQYLDLEPDIEDRPGALVLPSVAGSIRFESITLEYLPGRKAVDAVSFDITPGQVVALVGPSGAGKTSVTYMLPRIYEPTDGRIFIDDYEIRDVTIESLRKQIGYVTQETFLFHASVRDNLLIANANATQQELEDACEAAACHDVIVKLPDGYDTVVGERGYRLSGGEKQRLAIARVLLKNPRILLLDEATASLDTHSERTIQSALNRLMEGRTTIVIAHRLSTILTANLILYIEKGRIVEHGTHDELMKLGSHYQRLYKDQFEQSAELGSMRKEV